MDSIRGMLYWMLNVSPCILASPIFREKRSMRHTALSAHRVSPDFSPDFFLAYIASMRRVAQTARSKGLCLYIRIQKHVLSVSRGIIERLSRCQVISCFRLGSTVGMP